MNSFAIQLDPLMSIWGIVMLGGIGALLVGSGLYNRLPGAIVRGGALVLLVATLLNPSLVVQEFEAIKTVVGIVTDTSDSQKLNGRQQQTERAEEKLEAQLARFPQFEIRKTTTDGSASSSDASTAMFSALSRLMQDVPPSRVGGVVMITDGQVHDVPDNVDEVGFQAPIHALITGKENDKDRRIVMKKIPRFGIVGEEQEITYAIEDSQNNNESADVEIFIDGEKIANQRVRTGEDATFAFTLPHGGKNIVELKTPEINNEITDINNNTFANMQGIRENLRVLLISGAPHAGERTWRNLLKSDTSVDLVHFTILRPAYKEDGTPVNELSLIAFPIRELFIDKIQEFDLIIFDRYKRYNILPTLYFDSIAQYVTNGGAILIAVGDEHAKENSMQTSPLAQIFPVVPTGEIMEKPFRPKISDEGQKHPVTRGLESNKQWSRWFRHIANSKNSGDAVMVGVDENPLLVLDRQGNGRVAMLMSDHVWLWARGFEGGGPHTKLLRRLAHWLMREPSLEEEALEINVEGNEVQLKRQTMAETVTDGILIDPVGGRHTIELKDSGNGVWEDTFQSEVPGLYRFENGELSALGHVGPLNPREYKQIISTTEQLEDIVKDSGGAIVRVGNEGENVPRIVSVRGASNEGRVLSGSGSDAEWFGILDRQANRLIGLSQFSLFSTLLGLLAVLVALSYTWWREGRN